MADERDIERFWSKVQIGAENECWPWRAGLQHGYGCIRIKGKAVRANAFALNLKLGRPLGEGMRALHTCDNPPCCNPGHLFEGSDADNVADRNAKGRTFSIINEDVVREVRRRRAADQTYTEICEATGVGRATAFRFANKIKKGGRLTVE